jgi:hypothetical protein
MLEAKLEAAERRLRVEADAARETYHWIYVPESAVVNLADGIVTNDMKALFRYALSGNEELERNAEKPARKRKAG